MFQPRPAIRHLIAAPLVLVVILGCMGSGGGRGRPGSPDDNRPRQRRSSLPGVMDPVALYESAGLMAAQEPLPFVGNVRYLAGSSSDTTLVFVTLSLANRALTFTPEGEGLRAGYSVVIDVRQGAITSAHADARESVRVASFKETTRADESVIFQEFLSLLPGQHVLTVAIRDEGSSRTSTADLPLIVPRIGQTTALSSPVAVYQAQPRSSTDSIPVLVANPRATAVFGRDSTIQLYLEGYNLAPDAPVDVVVTNDKKTEVWRDTVTLSRHGSVSGDIVIIPVGRLGVGQLAMTATLIGSSDTVRSPVFVNFADDIAIASFEQMLDLLRYFTTEDRLRALRDTSTEQRAAAWGTFWRETDPAPTTPEHEGLREYFNRIQLANDRFREEGIPGWLTDRGMVYVTLGEPDQVLEQGESNLSQRGRAQMWTYNQHQLQVVFIDQTGFGRWRMTTASEGDFQSVSHRVRARD